MHAVEDVYTFVAEHQILNDHSDAAYLRQLFLDLAAGTFEERGRPPPAASVLSFF